MGHVTPTPSGNWRANWRDAAGKQKSKTFDTKREARRFLAETESTLAHGTYVDPHAAKGVSRSTRRGGPPVATMSG